MPGPAPLGQPAWAWGRGLNLVVDPFLLRVRGRARTQPCACAHLLTHANPRAHVHPRTHRTRLYRSQVLQGLEAKPVSELEAFALGAQKWAYRYLSQHAKAMYVRRAVQMYNRLFAEGEMQALMGKVQLERLSLEHLLDSMKSTSRSD